MALPGITIKQVNGGRHGRYYKVTGDPRVEGKRLTSVTKALNVIDKPALIGWSNKQGRIAMSDHLKPWVGRRLSQKALDDVLESAKAAPWRRARNAANLGTRAHALIARMLDGEDIQDIPEDLVTVMESFQDWHDWAGLTIDLSEHYVYSAEHLYGGTFDATAWRGKLYVALDWKTSNGLYKETTIQVAAYANALREMYGQEVAEGWAVRLGKDEPEFEALRVNDMDRAFAAFLHALELSRYLSGKDQWEETDIF